MSITKEEITSSYPFPVYSYKVNINGKTMAFSEVSGLNIDYEHQVYKHGYSYTNGYNIVRGRMKPVTITMKRGVIKKQSELYNWIKKDKSWWAKFFTGRDEYSITIDLCDETAAPLVRWKVMKAIPLKLDAPTFNASSNEVAIESLEFISYDLEIEHI